MADPNDITELPSQALSPDERETRVSAVREAGQTLVAPVASDSSGPTQYTQFTQGNNTSSGFAEANAIARQARAGSGSGSLLKKRFLLEDVLGQGGMGTVYKARDLRKVEAEDPHPYIAVKVLNQAFKDHPDAFVTLQQETAKSHILAHPNIVTAHDFDRDGDTLFMTMELLEGEPLDHVIKAHRNTGLPKERALAIVRDLCAALAYAHQRHIIHADFKPGNVFVCDSGTTKILDFGIARAASKETQKHTFDASTLGALTPAYATVEMVEDKPLTFADDVYALACVTYELISGRHPYHNVSALDARQQGLKLKPIDGLTHNEWKALSKALALEKKARTATVLEFRSGFFPRRHPMALTAATAMLIVAAGGAIWFGYSQHQAKIKIQNTIAEHIGLAQTCFANSDFACAAEHSLVAVNLDASNNVASQLLVAAQLAQQKQEAAQHIATLINEGEQCLAAQDDGCAQVKAREALSLDAANTRAQQLSLAANNLEQNQTIADYIQQADDCLQHRDLTCADVFAKKAADLNPNHPAVKALGIKLGTVQQQLQLASQAQQQKVSDQIQLAQDCMAQKKYDCVIKQANVALALDPANAQAMELRQIASVADQQGRDAREKVDKILAQARDCLEKKKNYSCAIAKAEAALDLMPNNQDAATIKFRAQETQRKIKETGFTIK